MFSREHDATNLVLTLNCRRHACQGEGAWKPLVAKRDLQTTSYSETEYSTVRHISYLPDITDMAVFSNCICSVKFGKIWEYRGGWQYFVHSKVGYLAGSRRFHSPGKKRPRILPYIS